MIKVERWLNCRRRRCGTIVVMMMVGKRREMLNLRIVGDGGYLFVWCERPMVRIPNERLPRGV